MFEEIIKQYISNTHCFLILYIHFRKGKVRKWTFPVVDKENEQTWYSWKYTNPVQMEKNVQVIWNIGTISIASKNESPSFSLAICEDNKFKNRISWMTHVSTILVYNSSMTKQWTSPSFDYPKSSCTKKQQEHGIREPAVQWITTWHGQS